MSHEDGDGHEKHTANGHHAKEIAIVIGRLIVLPAKGQIVITQQADANNSQ